MFPSRRMIQGSAGESETVPAEAECISIPPCSHRPRKGPKDSGRGRPFSIPPCSRRTGPDGVPSRPAVDPIPRVQVSIPPRLSSTGRRSDLTVPPPPGFPFHHGHRRPHMPPEGPEGDKPVSIPPRLSSTPAGLRRVMGAPRRFHPAMVLVEPQVNPRTLLNRFHPTTFPSHRVPAERSADGEGCAGDPVSIPPGFR